MNEISYTTVTIHRDVTTTEPKKVGTIAHNKQGIIARLIRRLMIQQAVEEEEFNPDEYLRIEPPYNRPYPDTRKSRRRGQKRHQWSR